MFPATHSGGFKPRVLSFPGLRSIPADRSLIIIEERKKGGGGKQCKKLRAITKGSLEISKRKPPFDALESFSCTRWWKERNSDKAAVLTALPVKHILKLQKQMVSGWGVAGGGAGAGGGHKVRLAMLHHPSFQPRGRGQA